MQTYLPRSATFVHTLLAAQSRYRPVVLAAKTANLDEFPLDPVIELTPREAPLQRRALRRAAAYSARMATAFDHAVVRGAQRHDCSVIHAHFGPAGWLALPARRRLGIPLVTTFYGYDLALSDAEPEPWLARYAELFAAGDLFVCEGSAMAAQLGSIGAPREQVRVVRIGIDLAKLPFEPRPVRSPLVVFQAARFVEKKGIDVSLRAFAAALPELGDAELWIGGDGPLRSELEQLAGELGLEDTVRFLGMLSYDDHRQALARADIGIQPSRTASDGDTEGGAPTVLLELQAVGVPVVATRHADIPEVVASPEDLAEENDMEGVASTLVRLAAEPAAERTARLQRARAYVEREHDSRRVAEQVERLYDEALGRMSPPAT